MCTWLSHLITSLSLSCLICKMETMVILAFQGKWKVTKWKSVCKDLFVGGVWTTNASAFSLVPFDSDTLETGSEGGLLCVPTPYPSPPRLLGVEQLLSVQDLSKVMQRVHSIAGPRTGLLTLHCKAPGSACAHPGLSPGSNMVALTD